ncbi:MAG: trehalose-phosphatase [Nitrospirota bacterium]
MSDATIPAKAVIDLRRFDALLVDLDGVVTKTAAVHAAAWKQLFDEYLRRRAESGTEVFVPFDIEADYRRLVDGKPRADGVRSFLASRAISVPDGSPDDGPDAETVHGLGNRKNLYFQERLQREGVEVYEPAVAMLRNACERGCRLAVVSSSRNCEAVVKAAGLDDLFDVRVDGVEMARLGIKGKPAPAVFLEAAKRLGVGPERAVVIEDAVAGVQAGRKGRFGLVVGVDRGGQAEALRQHGADVVVSDLGQIVFKGERVTTRAGSDTIPSALDRLADLARRSEGKRIAVFLDYDGTLTPIVARPDLAVLSDAMRATVADLAARCPVAVISGRDRANVAELVRLESVYYAGSHGFDISGPDGCRMQHEGGVAAAPALRAAEEQLRSQLAGVDGAAVEGKAFAIAVHYRLVDGRQVPLVAEVVNSVAAGYPGLRVTGGKKIFELRPRLKWDKGRAVLWLLRALKLDLADVVPIYIGDDETDEDAFEALAECGIGILVRDGPRETTARYALDDPEDVRRFLEGLRSVIERRGR